MARIMTAMAITNVMINAIPDMNNLLVIFPQYTTCVFKEKNYVIFSKPNTERIELELLLACVLCSKGRLSLSEQLLSLSRFQLDEAGGGH